MADTTIKGSRYCAVPHGDITGKIDTSKGWLERLTKHDEKMLRHEMGLRSDLAWRDFLNQYPEYRTCPEK